MKKIILAILAFLSISIISANTAFNAKVAQIKLTKTHLVKLNYVEEKIDLLEKQTGKILTPEEKDFILDSIINTELIKQAAKRDGIIVTEDIILNMLRQQVGAAATDQQIKDTLADQYKKPYPEVLEALIEQLTMQEYIKQAGSEDLKKYAAAVTKEDITNFYNANKTKFVNPDLVRVNHIFFETRGKTPDLISQAKKNAETALLQIKQGEKTFEELVQTVSEDKASAQNGGELGFVSRAEASAIQLLGSSFIDAVFKLPMEEVHGVLESTSGYHIVMITEKRSARILGLNDRYNPSSPLTVAQVIQQNLQQQKSTTAFAQVTELVLERLRKEATVKIFDKSIPWK